jgi:14-3-3 protein epsilon
MEEQNHLSFASKNVISEHHTSWRIMSSMEQTEVSKGNEGQVSMIKGYRERIESQLANICEYILDVLRKNLILSTGSGESKVFENLSGFLQIGNTQMITHETYETYET